MRLDQRVFVALKRPLGYEDVHAELVAEDAMSERWSWEVLNDQGEAVIVAIDRPEGYRRVSATAVAKEAVKTTWPTWSVTRST